MALSGRITFICKFSVSSDLLLLYPKLKIAIACLSGEGEKRGGLREQALMRREDLSNTREEERRMASPRKEEGGMMVRRESSPRREGGARRERYGSLFLHHLCLLLYLIQCALNHIVGVSLCTN